VTGANGANGPQCPLSGETGPTPLADMMPYLQEANRPARALLTGGGPVGPPSPENRMEQDPARDCLGRFLKGSCGNFGGRPRTYGLVRDLAREETEDSIAVLKRLRDGARSEMVRLLAAEALLNRGWGRPPQAVKLSDSDDPDGGAVIELVSSVPRPVRPTEKPRPLGPPPEVGTHSIPARGKKAESGERDLGIS
jgi:hypothetical protein